MPVTLPLLPLLPVGELEPALLTLDAGAGINEPDVVTDNCSALASVTGNRTPSPIDQVNKSTIHLHTHASVPVCVCNNCILLRLN